MKTYLKNQLGVSYAIYVLERKRLTNALKEKLRHTGANFSLPEFLDSLSLKLASDWIVYTRYWHTGNRLVNQHFRTKRLSRQKVGNAYRYTVL